MGRPPTHINLNRTRSGRSSPTTRFVVEREGTTALGRAATAAAELPDAARYAVPGVAQVLSGASCSRAGSGESSVFVTRRPVECLTGPIVRRVSRRRRHRAAALRRLVGRGLLLVERHRHRRVRRGLHPDTTSRARVDAVGRRERHEGSSRKTWPDALARRSRVVSSATPESRRLWANRPPRPSPDAVEAVGQGTVARHDAQRGRLVRSERLHLLALGRKPERVLPAHGRRLAGRCCSRPARPALDRGRGDASEPPVAVECPPRRAGPPSRPSADRSRPESSRARSSNRRRPPSVSTSGLARRRDHDAAALARRTRPAACCRPRSAPRPRWSSRRPGRSGIAYQGVANAPTEPSCRCAAAAPGAGAVKLPQVVTPGSSGGGLDGSRPAGDERRSGPGRTEARPGAGVSGTAPAGSRTCIWRAARSRAQRVAHGVGPRGPRAGGADGGEGGARRGTRW